MDKGDFIDIKQIVQLCMSFESNSKMATKIQFGKPNKGGDYNK